jgi:tRNA(Ile)-lysidine synthase
VSIAEEARPIGDAEADRLFADLLSEEALVVAVSGGSDSTALLYLLARWKIRHEPSPQLTAVTVDHGLRAASRHEAAAVKAIATQLGVAHRTLRWTGDKPATRLQEKARAARYRLLVSAAHKAGARCIVTAHTLDDQAETVLFRLARGSGLAGIGAMARVSAADFHAAAPEPSVMHSGKGSPAIVRPLLDVPKARLAATLRAAGIAHAEDPSNDDPRFARVRWRKLAPGLAAEGLTAERLGQLARRVRRNEAAMDAIVLATFDRLGSRPAARTIAFDVGGLRDTPAEIVLRLVGRAAGEVGDEGPVELGKLESMCESLSHALERPAGRFRRTLAGALVSLQRDCLIVERAPQRRHRSRT